jgi:hypothetical protein
VTDFYEEDEPLEKIQRAFQNGMKDVTSKIPEVDVLIADESATIEEHEDTTLNGEGSSHTKTEKTSSSTTHGHVSDVAYRDE